MGDRSPFVNGACITPADGVEMRAQMRLKKISVCVNAAFDGWNIILPNRDKVKAKKCNYIVGALAGIADSFR